MNQIAQAARGSAAPADSAPSVARLRTRLPGGTRPRQSSSARRATTTSSGPIKTTTLGSVLCLER